MKTYIRIILITCFCTKLFAYEFKEVNERDDSLAFNILSDSTVEFTCDEKVTYPDYNYRYLTCDTLFIPKEVSHGGKTYSVIGIGANAFNNSNPSIKVVNIHEGITSIYYLDGRVASGAFVYNNLQEIIVSPSNPTYKSENGYLLTKDGTLFLAYPLGSTSDTLLIPEGIAQIQAGAMLGAVHLKYLELPLTLKSLSTLVLAEADSLNKLVVKDSVETLERYSLGCLGLSELTIGSRVSSVNNDFLQTDSVVNIYFRTNFPPTIQNYNASTFLSEIIARGSRLLVPRQSINAYRQADGWKNFGENILPIEPPVVSTEEGVTISWVQSFSATGYVWYLYKDEAHTQVAMSLAFDKDGRLQEIVLNSPAPQRVEAEDVEEGNNEAERFAEYFSFTIKNLSSNTNYYYLRQTLWQGEVIETEEGTFNTTPGSDTPTAIQDPTPSLPAIEGEDKVTKILQDGTILLLRNGKRYGICGEEHQ